MKTLWSLTVPSTAILGSGPRFEERIGRACALVFEIEGKDDRSEQVDCVLEGVEAYKCTYFNACEPEALMAYGNLVDREDTDWLRGVQAQLVRMNDNASGLRHLMIYFDDGPCYEFICRSFHIERPK